MESKYIFGIIESPGNTEFNICGRNGSGEVYAIPYKDISAVVTDSSVVDFTRLPGDQVAHCLLAHQQIIELVMETHSIVPMRLGTYALNAEEIVTILNKGYRIFKDVLRKIENKIELDVVATWNDPDTVIKEVSEEPEVKKLKGKLLAKPEGISTDDKVLIGKLIKAGIDRRREALAGEITDVLGSVCLDSRAHPLMNDGMILNTAFFIERQLKKVFDGLLNDLDDGFAKRINFRCVGPLPPYSFYTIETNKLSFEDVDRARKVLSLGNKATKEDIIMAYRSSAKRFHPDTNPDIPGAESQFHEINRANHILLEYCQGDACVFENKEFLQNSIVIKVK